MAKKKAAVAETVQADPALARLPADAIEPLKTALASGRYLLFIVRLDPTARQLHYYRHISDIPKSDHEIILNMLRGSLADV